MRKKTSKKAAKKRKVAAKLTRSDQENNRVLISTEMFKLIQKNPRIPTHKKLAEVTGLCEKTIERHLKHPSFKDMKSKLRSMSDMMLVKFASKVANSSNPTFWDMYFTLIEPEYAEAKQKKSVDLTSKGKAIKQLVVSVTDDETKKAVNEL